MSVTTYNATSFSHSGLTHWPNDRNKMIDCIDFFIARTVSEINRVNELSSDHSVLILTLSDTILRTQTAPERANKFTDSCTLTCNHRTDNQWWCTSDLTRNETSLERSNCDSLGGTMERKYQFPMDAPTVPNSFNQAYFRPVVHTLYNRPSRNIGYLLDIYTSARGTFLTNANVELL